ncbi:tRNA (adenosine(37)-N6)-threonylcarbamoyltransferase complex dimerization subunit type 1 TsaB [Sphingobacterium sp. LRF_L2]|uniref:tRNA (adenosine(37)-N6)-threonylcarbamoyltransferase complex dimerization subunit type 1 TsaB n=1 Tax=Sphingobacterium sp. LRF_L2 TaxID=3369421 RepID=UPI003F6347C2
MKDIYILQIETATAVCSVALSKNGEHIASVEADEPNLHASRLTLFIEEVISSANITLSSLAAIAVSMGPGSYTGLRIGVSTAKGLCYGLDIPLLAINTLDAMAVGFTDFSQADILVPMIDARRMEVYTANYNTKGERISDVVAAIIDESSFDNESLAANYVLFGSGADKFQELFSNHSRVRIAPGFSNSASFLGSTAFEKFQRQQFEDLIYFEPFYLKDFIATTPKKR